MYKFLILSNIIFIDKSVTFRRFSVQYKDRENIQTTITVSIKLQS